jgi:hypothetical protein
MAQAENVFSFQDGVVSNKFSSQNQLTLPGEVNPHTQTVHTLNQSPVGSRRDDEEATDEVRTNEPNQ